LGDIRADQRYLRTVAYADDSGLRDRRALYAHQHPRIDLVAEVITAVGTHVGEWIADVGCGNGQYLPHVSRLGRVVGLDLSPGMLRSVAPEHGGPLMVADAQRLPLKTASIGAVIMMHTLYHLGEPNDAISQAARVLKPGGRLVAGVGGPNHLNEISDLWDSAVHDAGLTVDADVRYLNTRVPESVLEDLLRQNFGNVVVRRLTSTAVVRTPEPVLRHAASTTAARTARARGTDLIPALAEQLHDHIARDGHYTFTTQVSLRTSTKDR